MRLSKLPTAITSVLITVLLTPFGTLAADAAPNPCSPVIAAPQSGSTVPQNFRIRILPGDFSDCRIDELRYAIVEISPDGGNRTVYFTKSDCCEFMQTGHPLVDMRAPEDKLKPDTDYVVQAQFVDRTVNIFGGLDHMRAELGPIAVIPVTTEKSETRTRRHGDENTRPDAMVFALDMMGRFGHGRAASVSEASRIALDYCDGADCRTVSEPTREQCHALAQRTTGGYWWGIGAAATDAEAQRLAQGFCERGHDGTCTMAYSYCK